jgi:predicted anti-sigma-YlaC factor YlaD
MKEHDNCLTMLSLLSDFVDGELNQELCLQIETHLSQCPDCSIVVDTLKKTIYLYQSNSKNQEQVPEDVRERLFKCLNLEEYLKPNQS